MTINESSDIMEGVYFADVYSTFNSQISAVEFDWITLIHEEIKT